MNQTKYKLYRSRNRTLAGSFVRFGRANRVHDKANAERDDFEVFNAGFSICSFTNFILVYGRDFVCLYDVCLYPVGRGLQINK